ncbi:S8 family peptidase [Flavobacterium noncentrifugens]|nr:S8 family serine peptidase [Flavobacterium noncentrifugens]
MIKSNLKLLLFLFLIVSCSKDDNSISIENQVAVETFKSDPMTPQQINSEIDRSIQSKGSFNWSEASTYILWSATKNGNYIVSIGFGNGKNDFDRSKSASNQKIQEAILKIILDNEATTLDKTLISQDEFLNSIDVIVTKPQTIAALRKSKYIRYIEPGDYKYFAVRSMLKGQQSTNSSSGSGCGFDSSVLSSADYTVVTPNAKAAWTLYQHNIPAAWNYSTGRGITIGIVDTGVSPNQTLLGSNFNDGLSTGRTIQKYGTYVDSVWPWSTTTDGPNDQCGHGTSMASAAAAPRNDNGLPVGVAYNANLVTYRAASNVVLDGFQEQSGVKNALTALGNNTNVKIISMSMGHIFSVGKIEDGIKYAYSKGKLIFCAGGTSTSFTTFVGVIFPASMAEAVAVTGIKEGATYEKCDDCHSGSKIDFTVVMQRTATGNTTPVVSYYDNQSDYVGGSSVATATTAGIAALVWAKNPTWTRDQVLNKMKQSARFYPTKNPEFGYGNINALQAVQ